MFDIGWPELLLIMVVALVVIGPKELPGAIRTVAAVIRKVRGMAREFQSGLDDIVRESGIDDVKSQFDDVVDYDPGKALEAMAESDPDFNLNDLIDPTTGNSILDAGPDAREEAVAGADKPQDPAPGADETTGAAPTDSPDTPNKGGGV